MRSRNADGFGRSQRHATDGPSYRIPHRYQHGRHRRRGRRHLGRRRQCRGPPRKLGRAGRHLRLGTRSGGRCRPPRPCLRGYGRAGAQEHRTARPGLPSADGCQVDVHAADLRPCPSRQAVDRGAVLREYERRSGAGVFRRRHGRGDHHRVVAHPLALCHRPQFELHLQRPSHRREAGRARTECPLCPRRLGAQGGRPRAHHRTADRCAERRASVGRPLRRLSRRCVRASGQGGDERRRRHRTDIASRRDRALCRPLNERSDRLRPLSACPCDGLVVGTPSPRGAPFTEAGNRARSRLRARARLGRDLLFSTGSRRSKRKTGSRSSEKASISRGGRWK